MSDQEKPPRLIDDPEFRDALRAVKGEEMSPERLARNLRSITPTISQPPPPATLPIATIALTIGGIAGVLAILWVAASALFVANPGSTETASPTPTVEDVVTLPPSATAEAGSATPTPAAHGSVATPFTATPNDTISLADFSPSPTIASGTLGAELALYEEARANAKGGNYAGALGLLDELLSRYPLTTLKPEAELERADVLVRAGRLDEASALLGRLVGDGAHAGRRAELERTLGDVERERGDCASARLHYRAALDAGASGAEASAVRRGLGMCEAQ